MKSQNNKNVSAYRRQAAADAQTIRPRNAARK